jgi:capsid protein
MVEADQWQLVIPQLVQPCWRRCLAELAIFNGAIDPETPAVFTPPRFGLLDPAKEVPAQIAAIQAGLISYQNTVRREGDDPVDTLDEIEAFQKEAARRGIRLTSIPPAQLPANASAAGGTPPPEDEGGRKKRPREEDDEADAA